MTDLPERTLLAPDLDVSRVITGLWQVADLERDGQELDRNDAAQALIDYADQGFNTFDMADHYGSAELISGEARRRLLQRDGETGARFFTKWCAEPHEDTPEAVRAGIRARTDRLGVDTIDLLQLHWWAFENPGFLVVMDELMRLKQQGVIGHIGLTNVDSDHLHLLLADGYEIATNQVSCSLLDRRALGEMSKVCLAHDVKLLTYGTLAGGFFSEKWLNVPEPDSIPDWSKMKYKRFIDSAGGWTVFQTLLRALDRIARRHGVTIANVATRWVLDNPAVGAIIVGARITEAVHRSSNATLFSFSLTNDDRAEINTALEGASAIPGDCGDEYRKPPFLTASGDLSHHLDGLPKVFPVHESNGRSRVFSGSEWEPVAGFSRAIRSGNRILVSGTTATCGSGRIVCPGDVRGQTVYILDKINAAVTSLGGSPSDIVRTRIYMRDCTRWEEAAAVHGRYFAGAEPASTLLEISRLVGDYEIEIEAEADVHSAP